MGRVSVIEFVSIDGVMEDPDGKGGFDRGGGAFRHGPEAVAGDKFKLGRLLDTGALLLGRKTWRQFSRIWPSRNDAFSVKMNNVAKFVASPTLTRVDEWQNSQLLQGDLVDEVRLKVLPLVIGTGTRLFDDGTPVELELISTEQSGAAALLTYQRAGAAS